MRRAPQDGKDSGTARERCAAAFLFRWAFIPDVPPSQRKMNCSVRRVPGSGALATPDIASNSKFQCPGTGGLNDGGMVCRLETVARPSTEIMLA